MYMCNITSERYMYILLTVRHKFISCVDEVLIPHKGVYQKTYFKVIIYLFLCNIQSH